MPTKAIATRQRQNDQGLTLPQQAALDLLAMGKSDTETASEIGVARETVSRWRSYSPLFQAELNARRVAIWQASADKLRCLTTKALSTLEIVLDDGSIKPETRIKAAAEILKIVGLTTAGNIGPTDPNTILRAVVGDERNRQKRDRLDYSFDTGDGLPTLEAHMAKKGAELEALANGDF